MEAIPDPEERNMIIERIACKFASDYLMPLPVLVFKFHQSRQERDVPYWRHTMLLADVFNVSKETMQYHLSDHRLVPK